FSSTNSAARNAMSEAVSIDPIVPLAFRAIARAKGGKLRVDAVAYDADDNLLDTSDETAETVGTEWQVLQFEWTPPQGTDYIKVRATNDGAGMMWFDKVSVLVKEALIYRGRIETYTPRMNQEGE